MRSSDGLDDDALARIDTIVATAVEQGQVPGVVAAVARGDMVHVASGGAMTVGGAPMRRDTLFRIASITKPMTAATGSPSPTAASSTWTSRSTDFFSLSSPSTSRACRPCATTCWRPLAPPTESVKYWLTVGSAAAALSEVGRPRNR